MINGDAEDPRASAAPQYPFVRGEAATYHPLFRKVRAKEKASGYARDCDSLESVGLRI